MVPVVVRFDLQSNVRALADAPDAMITAKSIDVIAPPDAVHAVSDASKVYTPEPVETHVCVESEVPSVTYPKPLSTSLSSDVAMLSVTSLALLELLCSCT